jgi:hypothetical protein
LHNTKWSDGKKKGWKPLASKKKNPIQISLGNEEMDTHFMTPTKQ